MQQPLSVAVRPEGERFRSVGSERGDGPGDHVDEVRHPVEGDQVRVRYDTLSEEPQVEGLLGRGRDPLRNGPGMSHDEYAPKWRVRSHKGMTGSWARRSPERSIRRHST